MKKRFLLFSLIVCLVLTLCACDTEESTIVTLGDEGVIPLNEDDVSPNLISIFSSRDEEEYLKFLTNLDANYEIIDITTGMDTDLKGESYVVTYMTKTDISDIEMVSYKYYLYKARQQSEYLSFYATFDFSTYEIVDISTRLSVDVEGESYMVTYRKPN